MASTQKKSGGSAKGVSSKGVSAQKKTAPKKSGKSGSSGGKHKKITKKIPVYRPNMLARGIGAAVCLFAAVMLVLGIFGTHAVVVDLLGSLAKGLVGWGFYALPAVLVLCAWVLLFRREKPVRLRLWCAGCFPWVLGALLHITSSPYTYEMGPAALPKLWTDGGNLFSGGVLGGMLGISFATWFSKLGAGLIFVLAMLALLAGAVHLTPAKLMAANARRRERDYDEDEYDEDDYEDYGEDAYDDADAQPAIPDQSGTSLVPSFRLPWGKRGEGKKKILDLPLSNEEEKAKQEEKKSAADPTTQAATQALKGDRGSLFRRNSKVKSPDQVLEEMNQEGDAPIPDTIPAEDPLPAGPGDADAPPEEAQAPLWQEIPPEPTKAQRKQEIKQEAAQVEQTVQETLEAERPAYIYPELDLLTEPSGDASQAAHEELEGTLNRLASVLSSFGIDGHVAGAVQGPSVTRYEVSLEQGVRLNKLTNLSDDVALALGVSSVRIAPVPGKISVVGIEVPNKVVSPVAIREVLYSPAFRRHKSSVAFSVGKDIGGNYIVGDCSKLPHMLIAGTTGSGKSVCINSLIISMLYKSTPEETRLIMVDPKMVELGIYNGIPHLLIPVVTDPKKAAGALQWAVTEMMKRYRLFAEAGVRELGAYNQWARTQEKMETMPKIVIVIDELADLMLVAAKEVEESICRVAQMGRAAGMHLVIATQRPSADVITGLMKANIPSRVAFAVASSLESRIILDNTGAEKLVGKGDMLWFPLGSGKPLRVQGCFISDEEVAAVVDCVKQNSAADYDDDVMEQIEQHVTESEKKGKSGGGVFPAGDKDEEAQDELFDAAVDVILDLGQASVSLLQRRLKLGYARAARLVDQMEDKGIVGPSEGSKARQILITKDQWVQMQAGVDPNGTPPPVEEELMTFDAVPQSMDHMDFS